MKNGYGNIDGSDVRLMLTGGNIIPNAFKAGKPDLDGYKQTVVNYTSWRKVATNTSYVISSLPNEDNNSRRSFDKRDYNVPVSVGFTTETGAPSLDTTITTKAGGQTFAAIPGYYYSVDAHMRAMVQLHPSGPSYVGAWTNCYIRVYATGAGLPDVEIHRSAAGIGFNGGAAYRSWMGLNAPELHQPVPAGYNEVYVTVSRGTYAIDEPPNITNNILAFTVMSVVQYKTPAVPMYSEYGTVDPNTKSSFAGSSVTPDWDGIDVDQTTSDLWFRIKPRLVTGVSIPGAVPNALNTIQRDFEVPITEDTFAATGSYNVRIVARSDGKSDGGQGSAGQDDYPPGGTSPSFRLNRMRMGIQDGSGTVVWSAWQSPSSGAIAYDKLWTNATIGEFTSGGAKVMRISLQWECLANTRGTIRVRNIGVYPNADATFDTSAYDIATSSSGAGNILPSTYNIKLDRTAMGLGTMQVDLEDVTLDPAKSTALKHGGEVQLQLNRKLNDADAEDWK